MTLSKPKEALRQAAIISSVADHIVQADGHTHAGLPDPLPPAHLGEGERVARNHFESLLENNILCAEMVDVGLKLTTETGDMELKPTAKTIFCAPRRRDNI